MRIIAWIIVVTLFAVALVVLAGQFGLFTGQPPHLGVQGGRLKPPSVTSNSVSSQARLYPDHPQKDYATIAPMAIQGDGTAAIDRLDAVLREKPGCSVVTRRPDYIYVTCQTKWLKFTDDLEFWQDPTAHVIQVRSSSRLGRKDFGVNRARIESIRKRFDSTQPS